ncbi:uncharacterized protein LOC108139310 [Drosophila elegans]|uniref:uncharacterized protein LOC108139310 n=1 Tax=Drosophila elegans TaxID=30023 RepID=UPI0007E619EB|nr:uncharacterized protein LOC108139310 [Drosophila elegans]
MNFTIRLSVMLAILIGLSGNARADLNRDDVNRLQELLQVLPGTNPDMQMQMATLICQYRKGNSDMGEINGYILRLRELLLVHPGTDPDTQMQIVNQIYEMCRGQGSVLDVDGRCLGGLSDLIIQARNINWIQKYIREH